MNVALFFGSFNPVHIGHLIIGNHIIEYTDADELWYIISPQNPLKHKKNLLNEYDRLELMEAALESNASLKVKDIEFHLPRPSYTVNTLAHLKEKHSNNSFSLIMGSDTINSLPKWKNFEYILENHRIIHYPRPGVQLNPEVTKRAEILHVDAPLMEISASKIRKAIKKGYSIQYLVPDVVRSLIDKWGFYR